MNSEETSREEIILEAVTESDLADRSSAYWRKITSNALYNHLFEACNILRGPINQDEYKTYVIPLLFFKRVSDTYDEETQLAIEEYGEDVDDFDEDELHKFIIPDGCHWADIREQSENVGSAIVNAMVGIERANPDTLNGLFSSFDDANWTDKNKLSDERLKDLVEHMSKINVGNKNYSADVMGDAFGNHHLNADLLEEIVRTDEKQRYSFNEDHTLIRANQGHSIPVDVELEEKTPPAVLYHGTGEKYMASIAAAGLIPKSRLYVHLSSDVETARKVGSRHGKPMIYTVDCAAMAADGYKFYLSANNVWLTKEVPAKYLQKLEA